MRIACLFVITILSALSAAGQSSEWKQLFDGKDLTGWKHVGPGEMRVEDGLIQTHGGMGLLYWTGGQRSEEHTSELQSRGHLVCRLPLEKKKVRERRITNRASVRRARTT